MTHQLQPTGTSINDIYKHHLRKNWKILTEGQTCNFMTKPIRQLTR